MKINLTKLEVARRQLETAIKLYFQDEDPVSIHTLVSASYNIIKDVNKNRQGHPMVFKEQMITSIKCGRENEIKRKLNEAENFFKHADKDPEEILCGFNSEMTEFLMYDACTVYERLVQRRTLPLFRIFWTWFCINNENIFNFTDPYISLFLKDKKEILEKGKKDFFTEYFSLMEKAIENALI